MQAAPSCYSALETAQRNKEIRCEMPAVGRRKRQRKVRPIRVHAAASSKQAARQATAKFHHLLQQEQRLQARLENGEIASKRAASAENEMPASLSGADADLQAQLESVKREIDDMGGRRAYQAASQLNTREFRTSRIVTSTLSALGLRPASGEPLPQVLEIGAINPDLQRVRWLSTRAIDILSSSPGVEQRDFFSLVPPALAGTSSPSDGPYDVIVCSMVLNCVPTAAARGRMLAMCRDLLTYKPSSATADTAASASSSVSANTAASLSSSSSSDAAASSSSPTAATTASTAGCGRRGLAIPLLPTVRASESVWRGRGLVILTIPKRCVEKSPFTTTQSFEATCRLCGLETIGRRDSASIVTWLLAAQPDSKPRLGVRWVDSEVKASTDVGIAGANETKIGDTPEGVLAPSVVGAAGRISAVTRLNFSAAASMTRKLDDPGALDEPPKPIRRLAAKVKAEKTDFAVCFRVLGV